MKTEYYELDIKKVIWINQKMSLRVDANWKSLRGGEYLIGINTEA